MREVLPSSDTLAAIASKSSVSPACPSNAPTLEQYGYVYAWSTLGSDVLRCGFEFGQAIQCRRDRVVKLVDLVLHGVGQALGLGFAGFDR